MKTREQINWRIKQLTREIEACPRGTVAGVIAADRLRAQIDALQFVLSAK